MHKTGRTKYGKKRSVWSHHGKFKGRVVLALVLSRGRRKARRTELMFGSIAELFRRSG